MQRQQIRHFLVGVITRRFRRIAAQPDRGDVIGWAITIPVIMMLTIGSVQTVLWYQARNVCQAAAQAGVRAGKALNAPAGTGQSAASAYLTNVGEDTVVDGAVVERLSASSIDVRCTGSAERVIPIPGFAIDVHASATAQRERFTTRSVP